VLTSIIVTTYNQLRYTKSCLDSIRKYTAEPYEMIVVDNGSDAATVAYLRSRENVRLILNEQNRGFPAACNQGLRAASGDRICLLNNDMVVTRNWLSNLLICLEKTGAGIVGPKCNRIAGAQILPVEYQNLREMQHFAKAFNVSDPAKWQNTCRIGGGGMLFRRILLDQVGFLDERFTPGNYEDDDFSLRTLLAGHRLYIAGDTFIHHYGSNIFGQNRLEYSSCLEQNAKKFCDKWQLRDAAVTYCDPHLLSLFPQAAGNILDTCCGCGATVLELKNRGAEKVIGVTDSPELAKAASINLNEVYTGRFTEIILPPQEKFDLVLLNGTLSQTEDPTAVLHKAASHLTSSGLLAAVFPNAVNLRHLLNLVLGRRHSAGELGQSTYTPQDIHTLLENCRLQINKLATVQQLLTEAEKAFLDDLRQFLSSHGLNSTVLANSAMITKFIVLAGLNGRAG